MSKTLGFEEESQLDDEKEITGVVTVSNTSHRLKLAREYFLIRKLGEGGMGEVWLGKTMLFGKEQLVAVKILNKKHPPMVDSVERFHREAELLRQVKHSNIVAFYDYWESDDFAYLVMEFVAGSDLETYIQENGVLDYETVIVLTLQVLNALLYMQEEHGMHHRDIKPNNIQLMSLQANGHLRLKAMLIDFGNAKIGLDDSKQNSLTMLSGQMAGTPGYTAPSVSLDVYTEEDDVFSIACTVMYCLLGKNQFEVVNDLWASLKKVHDGVLDLGQYEGTMLGQWIRINTAPQRKDRMSLSQAIHSLERMLKDSSGGMRQVSPEFVRVLGSDKALMAQLAPKSEASDIAHSSTLAMDANLMGQMTSPGFRLADLKAADEPRVPSREEQKLEKALSAIETGVGLDREKRRRSRIKFVLIFLAVFLLLALAAGLFWQFKLKSGQVKSTETTPESQPLKSQSKVVKALSAPKAVVAKKPVITKLKKVLPSVENLPQFKSIRQIYPLLRQADARQKLLADAESFASWAQLKGDSQAWQQAEWRWLAFFRKAPVPEKEKLPVIQKLFNCYCQTKQLKQQRNMAYFFKKLGGKTPLLCKK